MKKKLLLIALGFVLICIIVVGVYVYCNVNPSCRYSDISFQVTLNDELIVRCDNAYIDPLAGGGYRFHCGTEFSIYIIYSSLSGPPVDGTIKTIWIEGEERFYTPYFASEEAKNACPAAKALKRTTGEPPLPTTLFGDLKKGKYDIMLAKPCGKLVLEIAEPLSVD